jgi:hypothetical protein
MRRLAVLALLLGGSVAHAQGPSPAVPPPSQAPAQYPETWLPRTGVELIGLDKITTRVTPISGKVGQKLSFGTLEVVVRTCVVRGPDQPADQAAFLDVTDGRDPAFAFHGWMMLSSPGVSVVEHPVYDLRLKACAG